MSAIADGPARIATKPRTGLKRWTLASPPIVTGLRSSPAPDPPRPAGAYPAPSHPLSQDPVEHLSPFKIDAADCIEIAKKANQSGNTAKVDHFLELALSCIDQSATKAKDAPLQVPAQPQGNVKPTSPREIYQRLCLMLRAREVGWRFTFTQAADYIESLPGLNLDRRMTTTERRERWRNHVSYSIEKLRAFGWIQKGAKNTEYVLIRMP